MLKIQNNSRQIPDIEKYTADKKYNDLLYGILQQESYYEDGKRYIDKSEINFTELAEKMGVTRQTSSTKFKNLIELGLIAEEKEPKIRYQLNYLDKTICSLVPLETLRKISDALSQNAISIYVYLLKRFIANQEKEYIVTMAQMKKFIGIATSTTSNNHVINNILEILEKIGLVAYDLVQEDKDKRNIIIRKVTNVIESKQVKS
jgi:predicted transcriptional regulator